MARPVLAAWAAAWTWALLAALLSTPAPAAALQYSTDKTQLGKLSSGIVQRLVQSYSPNPTGAFPEAQVHWHESGIGWQAVFAHHTATGDGQFDDTVTGCLINGTYGTKADLLNGFDALSSMAGKWNDDIGWWGYALARGMEIFKDAGMPQTKVKWSVPVVRTFNQMNAQWDDQCGGGIYWSRNRQASADNQRLYKSSISNTLHILLGARLYAATGNSTYKSLSDRTYDWLVSSKMIDASGLIHDGTNVGACGAINRDTFSYTSGTMLSALGIFYQKTKDEKYRQQGAPLLAGALKAYVRNGILTEPCELTAEQCHVGNGVEGGSGFKGALAQGMAEWITTGAATAAERDQIIKVLDASASAMLARCDTTYACTELWGVAPKSLNTYDARQQITAVQIMSAVALVHGANNARASTVDSAVGTKDRAPTEAGAVEQSSAGPRLAAAPSLTVVAAVSALTAGLWTLV